MAIGASIGASSYALLTLIGITLVAVGLSRNYFANLIQRTSAKLSWTFLLGAVFLSCTLITGSADLGTIAFATIVINSIFVAFPLFVRESIQLSNLEKEESLYLSHIFTLVLIFTFGLLIMPRTTILPSLDGTGGLLGLYTIIGFVMVLLGTVSSRLFTPRSVESVEHEDSDSSSPEDEDGPNPPSQQSGELHEKSTESEPRD